MYKIKYLIIVSILIISACFLYKNFYKKENITPKINLQNISEKTIKASKSVKEKHTNINQTDKISLLHSENTPNVVPKFSSDPLVQKLIISSKYHVCEQYFYKKIFLVKSYQKQYKSETQRKYYMNSVKNCEQINFEHPEYGFDKSKKQIFSKTKSTSKFGKLLEYNKEPYTHAESLFVFKTIARDYPDLINSPSIYKTMQYEIDVVIPALQQILQTTSENYVSRIINLTQSYLACDLGANCANDSSMMHSYCRSEANFCVKDFMTLFNTRLSQGVKSDVLIALPYIEKLFQVN